MRAPRRVQASGRTRPTVRQTRPGLQQSPHRPRTLPALPPSLRPASPRPGSAVRPIRPPFPFDPPASSPPGTAARPIPLPVYPPAAPSRFRRPPDPPASSRPPARRFSSRFRHLPDPPAASPPGSAARPIRPLLSAACLIRQALPFDPSAAAKRDRHVLLPLSAPLAPDGCARTGGRPALARKALALHRLADDRPRAPPSWGFWCWGWSRWPTGRSARSTGRPSCRPRS